MFGRIFRSMTSRNGDSKHKGKQRKRAGKHTDTESKRKNGASGKQFTHTTVDERSTMFRMRRQGGSVHDIAKHLGRSSRTVHEILTGGGKHPMPRRGAELQGDRTGINDDSVGRSRRRRRRKSKDAPGNGDDIWQSMFQKIKPILVQAGLDLLQNNPEFAQQLVASHYGVKIPKKTPDDIIFEHIKASPELLHRLAENYVERQAPKRKSDIENAAEVLDLAVTIAKQMAQGRWADVAETAVETGEFRKTVATVVQAQAAQQKASPPPSDPVGPAVSPSASVPSSPPQAAAPLRYPSLTKSPRRPRRRSPEAAQLVTSHLPVIDELKELPRNPEARPGGQTPENDSCDRDQGSQGGVAQGDGQNAKGGDKGMAQAPGRSQPESIRDLLRGVSKETRRQIISQLSTISAVDGTGTPGDPPGGEAVDTSHQDGEETEPNGGARKN